MSTAEDKIEMSPEDRENAGRWHRLAVCLGYNEMAKIGRTLGEKIYARLARDMAVKTFVAHGGNADLFASDEVIATIEVPQGPPHIQFGPSDEHDAKSAPSVCEGACPNEARSLCCAAPLVRDKARCAACDALLRRVQILEDRLTVLEKMLATKPASRSPMEHRIEDETTQLPGGEGERS